MNRRRRLLVGAAGVVVVVIAAVLFVVGTGAIGRSEVSTPSPSADPRSAAAAAVDWSHYRPGFRDELDGDSCEQLATAYTAADLTEGVVDPAPLQRYIVAVAGVRGCAGMMTG